MTTPFRPGLRGNRPRRDLPTETHRVNYRITAREVRVIGAEGENLGVLPPRDAIALAEAAELDLVEVSPNTSPPVCRIMDYGKFKYREQKKEAEARKKRTEMIIKELRIRYNTDVGDLETKVKQARDFIAHGDKVKFTMRFKGREAEYLKLGQEKLNSIIERLADVAIVDEKSPIAGRLIYLIFAPLRK